MIQTPLLSTPIAAMHRRQEMCERVSAFTDALGMPVDPGIFETVVECNLAGIPTFQSCEGHLDHGSPYPWVTVIDEEWERLFNRRWLAVCELEEQAQADGTPETYNRYLAASVSLRLWIEEGEHTRPVYRRLTSLLDTFYWQTGSDSPSRLVLRRFKSPGRYRLEPGFAETVERIPDGLKGYYLECGRAEMQRLTTFLREVTHATL